MSVEDPEKKEGRSSNSLILRCIVKARIPTSEAGVWFLYLYENNLSEKQHMAFVYGDAVSSRSLQDTIPNETNRDRIIRGANPIDNNDTSFYSLLPSPEVHLQPISEQLEEEATFTKEPPSTTFQNVILQNRLRHFSSPSSFHTYKSSTLYSHTKSISPLNNGINLNHSTSEPFLVRIHSECFTGETIHSVRCDCGEQLISAMKRIQTAGSGVIVYLRQEGRGIGLVDKLRAYNLQDLGHDTVTANLLLEHPPDRREYESAAKILEDLDIHQINLLTNNPDKLEQLQKSGIKIVHRIPLIPQSWEGENVAVGPSSRNISSQSENEDLESTSSGSPSELDYYMLTKIERMRHIIEVPPHLSK